MNSCNVLSLTIVSPKNTEGPVLRPGHSVSFPLERQTQRELDEAPLVRHPSGRVEAALSQ